MRHIQQKGFECLWACFAMLLDLPIDDVRNRVRKEHPEGIYDPSCEWDGRKQAHLAQKLFGLSHNPDRVNQAILAGKQPSQKEIESVKKRGRFLLIVSEKTLEFPQPHAVAVENGEVYNPASTIEREKVVPLEALQETHNILDIVPVPQDCEEKEDSA